MVGLLGFFGWEVTVISSNFISLQLIITMAVTIHLIVRYRELSVIYLDKFQHELVLETVRLKLTPCIYAALTTIAGFGSLLTCDIYPVITFGWMMVGGIIVSLIIVFIFFPAAMILLDKPPRDPCGIKIFPDLHNRECNGILRKNDYCGEYRSPDAKRHRDFPAAGGKLLYQLL
ncbi:MAG: hypothetical protein R2874_09440 [Desulfobacterales bacterium]